MSRVDINIFAARQTGCSCKCSKSCRPSRTIMDDIEDLKDAIKSEGLIDKVGSMKFINIFSPALEKYPQIFKLMSDETTQVPIVAFGEAVITEGNIDIEQIINELKEV